MSKLFALEDIDNTDVDVELEVGPEDVAGAVQQEVEADVAEVANMDSAIDEGTEAAEQLEQVEELVEGSLEEDGEGLDEVAAEAIRIAVEAICSKVGANPKSMSVLYATENFRSASSRRANTQYALESIGEFLKNLWERIKKAVRALIDRAVAFFNKHLSSLGRLLKAFESAKKTVSGLKGIPTNEVVDAPSGVRGAFPTKGAIGISTIEGYRKSLAQTNIPFISRLVENLANSNVSGSAGLSVFASVIKGAKAGKFTLGTESAPVAGGKYYSWEMKLEEEDDEGVPSYTIEFTDDHGDYTDGADKNSLDVEGKDTLKKLVEGGIKLIKEEVKRVEKTNSTNKKIDNLMKAIDKEINAIGENNGKEARTAARNNLRAFNLVMSKAPILESRMMTVFIAQMRGELAYISACVKNHKA